MMVVAMAEMVVRQRGMGEEEGRERKVDRFQGFFGFWLGYRVRLLQCVSGTESCMFRKDERWIFTFELDLTPDGSMS